MKKILRKEFRKKFLLAIFITVISELILELVNIKLIELISESIDNFFIHSNIDYSYFIKLGVVYLIFMLLIIPLSDLFGNLKLLKSGEEFYKYIFNTYLIQKYEYINSKDKGELYNNIDWHPISYTLGSFEIYTKTIIKFTTAIVIIVMLLTIHHVLFLVFFGITILLIVIPIITGKIKSRLFKENINLSNVAKEVSLETIELRDFIRINQLEKYQINRLKNVYYNYFKSKTKKMRFNILYGNFNSMVELFVHSMYFIIGAYCISKSIITVGIFITFYGLSIILKSTLKSLFSQYSSFIELKVVEEKLIELLGNIEVNKGIDVGRIKSIRCNNFNFGYTKDHVFLSNIKLDISEADKVLIQGSNGSGKSTLVKLLLKTHELERNSIYINDIDICDLNPYSLRKEIVYVPQKPLLLDATVYENIAIKCDDENRIIEYLNKFDILNKKDVMISENQSNLSGGEIQKISLIRALMLNPSVIIFDEIDNNLDKNSIDKLLNYINQLDCICILIMHKLKPRFINKVFSLGDPYPTQI
ncbi:ABC transporter ATP-binding protein [Mycoplasmatota bacterium]|nr:ABC transporter ATP-binding protein [Mycoplasmatota bacterium]